MKLIKNAVPHTSVGTKNADSTICLIQILPPKRAYRDPPKYPLIGDVAAYTNMAVDKREPRLKYYEKKKSKMKFQFTPTI